MSSFSYSFYILIFVITIAGIRLYKSAIGNSFPALIKINFHKKNIANGAGSVLWDVFFIFCLYQYWYKGITLSFISVILVSSFLFTILGWVDDLIEFKPVPKLKFQFLIGILSIFLYFKIKDIQFSLMFFSFSLLYFVWIVNSINFIDILDGLAGSISLIFLLAFAFIFYEVKNIFCFEFSIFWIIAILAFLTQNFKRPIVYLGDAGAHLIGTAIFFTSMEFFLNQKSISHALLQLIMVHSFLIFDFFYVCFIRYKKNHSLLLKSNDHFTFFISDKLHSHNKTITLLVALQAIASILFIINTK